MWLNRDHSTPEKGALISSALKCFPLYSTSKKKEQKPTKQQNQKNPQMVSIKILKYFLFYFILQEFSHCLAFDFKDIYFFFLIIAFWQNKQTGAGGSICICKALLKNCSHKLVGLGKLWGWHWYLTGGTQHYMHTTTESWNQVYFHPASSFSVPSRKTVKKKILKGFLTPS